VRSGAAAESPSKGEAFTVSQNEKAGTVTILVPARNGRVYWKQVAAGLSEAADLNGEAVSGLIPKGSFDPNSRRAWFTLFGINAAARGNFTLRMTETEAVGDGGKPGQVLRIVVQKAAFRDAKARLRSRLKSTDSNQWGLKFDGEELSQPHRKRIVVLVHGYNSRPEKLAGLASALQTTEDLHRVVWSFRYPNDGPVRGSGKLLASELTRLRKAHPNARVAIIAHSMGGLVARTAIEDAELDPGNVEQLIMVATPNQGSQLAFLPGGFDLLEHLAKKSDADVGRLKASFVDGLNEARGDLRPGSEFLTELNARPRNPRVAYSIILGNDAALSPESVAELTQWLEWAQKKSKTLQIIGPRLDPIVNDPSEFTRGEGDGVVAVERGRLAGVKDTIVLPFRHNAITGKIESEVEQKLLRAIIERLDDVK
jgi:pimeloyl-ACP methyl ester carboxylesterase